MRSRSRREETNWDGLTDAVTNLVGALVLVVVLVIAVTQPRTAGESTPPPIEREVGEELSMDQLLERIRLMDADAVGVRQSVTQVDLRLDDVENGVNELADEAASRSQP